MKSDVFRCKRKVFNQVNFIPDFCELHWTEPLEIYKNNINLSFSNYIKNIDIFLTSMHL